MTREDFFYQCIDVIEHWLNGNRKISDLREVTDRLYNEVTKPQWTSVEDELPKEHGRYLVVNGVTKEQEIFVYSNGIWWYNAYRCPIGVVTHWMPLPSIEHFADVSKKTSSSSEIPTNLKGDEQ